MEVNVLLWGASESITSTFFELSSFGFSGHEVNLNGSKRKGVSSSANRNSSFHDEQTQAKETKAPREKQTRKGTVVPAEKRCIATCKTGEQCSKAHLIESEYCRLHHKIKYPEMYPELNTPKIDDEIPAPKKKQCVGKGCTIMGGTRKKSYKRHHRRTRRR